MPFPNLDEATREGLDALTAEECSREVSYAYEHEILWYGVHAVAHVHLMRMARDIHEGKLSKEEFVAKYGLFFRRDTKWFTIDGLFGPLERIAADGIFIPQLAYCDHATQMRIRKVVNFFGLDYRNRIFEDCWVDKEYGLELTGRRWQASDLENPKLIEQGVKFGRDMWRTCVGGFERLKHRQPQKVTDLGAGLIAYYSEVLMLYA